MSDTHERIGTVNDTHGQDGAGWYGFDLDGTLAVYDKWEGIDHIGEPVKPMVDLIKKFHDEGKVVKILTARVAPRPNLEVIPTPHPFYADSFEGADDGDVPEYAAKAEFGSGSDRRLALAFYARRGWTAHDFISDWCLKNLGFLPEITHAKDYAMIELYDDRVKQVVPNEGVLVEDIAHHATVAARVRYTRMLEAESRLTSRWFTFHNAFMLGLLTAVAIFVVTNLLSSALKTKTTQQEAVEKLVEAVEGVKGIIK